MAKHGPPNTVLRGQKLAQYNTNHCSVYLSPSPWQALPLACSHDTDWFCASTDTEVVLIGHIREIDLPRSLLAEEIVQHRWCRQNFQLRLGLL